MDEKPNLERMVIKEGRIKPIKNPKSPEYYIKKDGNKLKMLAFYYIAGFVLFIGLMGMFTV